MPDLASLRARLVASAERAINTVKDGYLYAINGIASNPHKTFWIGGGLILLALVA